MGYIIPDFAADLSIKRLQTARLTGLADPRGFVVSDQANHQARSGRSPHTLNSYTLPGSRSMSGGRFLYLSAK